MEKKDNKTSFNEIIDANIIHQKGILGQNIGVAILDTGIAARNDFINRVIKFIDFVNNKQQMYDDCNHGSHVAGILASSKVNDSGEYLGVAPKCNIIALKVLDNKGNGKVSTVLQALNWVIDNKEKYNIRIVNISIGTPAYTVDDEKTVLVEAVNNVWDAGIVVVVAAGNNGPKRMSITTPGISRKVITVGACDDNRITDVQGEKLCQYSGRGPTVACVKKPDVVAPSLNILSCDNTSTGYIRKSGTSMATPMVSGAIALLLCRYPDLTNKEVKMRLMMNSVDLGLGWERQGWGMINACKLINS